MLTTIKGEIDMNTINVGEFDIPFIPMDISSRQKINNGAQALKNTLDRLDISSRNSRFHFFFFSQVCTEHSPG